VPARSPISLRNVLLTSFAVCAALSYCACRSRAFPTTEYDEGVYLATFRSIQAGFAPYRETYLSQPPGFLALTYPLYVLFGSTLEAARLAVFAYSVVGLFALGWLGWELGHVLFGLVAVAVLYSVPLYTREILTFHGDSLPATFSTLAIAAMLRFLHSERWHWLVLSATCVAIAGLIKGDVSVVPALGVLLLSGASWASWADWRTGGAQIAVFGAALACAAVLFTLPFGLFDVYESVVKLRVSAAQAAPADSHALLRFLQEKSELTGLLCMSAALSFVACRATAAARFPTLVLGSWLLTTFATLFIYRPLQIHHLVFLTVPAAALTASALCHLLTRVRWRWATACMVGFPLVMTLINQFVAAASAQSGVANPPQKRGIALVRAKTQAEDFIVCDDGIITGLSERRTPPFLTDLSHVRLRSGRVTRERFEAELDRFRPKLVLVWADRLTDLPYFADVMKSHRYQRIKNKDKAHQVYQLQQ